MLEFDLLIVLNRLLKFLLYLLLLFLKLLVHLSFDLLYACLLCFLSFLLCPDGGKSPVLNERVSEPIKYFALIRPLYH